MGGESLPKIANEVDEVIDFARQSNIIPNVMELSNRGRIQARAVEIARSESNALDRTRDSLTGVNVTARSARNFLDRALAQVDEIKAVPDLAEGPVASTARRVTQTAQATERTRGSISGRVTGEAKGMRAASETVEETLATGKPPKMTRKGKAARGVEERRGVKLSQEGKITQEAVASTKDVTTTSVREATHEATRTSKAIRRAIAKVIRDAGGNFGAKEISLVKKSLTDGNLYSAKGELVPLTGPGKKVMAAYLHELRALERSFVEDTLGPAGKPLQEALNAANKRYSLAADLRKMTQKIPNRRGSFFQKLWRLSIPGAVISTAGGGPAGYAAAVAAPSALKGIMTRGPGIERALTSAGKRAAPAARALTSRFAGEEAVSE